jgi:hypothetical protein
MPNEWMKEVRALGNQRRRVRELGDHAADHPGRAGLCYERLFPS